MITFQALKLYCFYEGDGERFVRLGSEEEKEILDYDSWVLIETFINDFQSIKNNTASRELSTSLQEKLLENCENEVVICQLKKIAEKEILYSI